LTQWEHSVLSFGSLFSMDEEGESWIDVDGL